jgi:nucleoside-diphosphate-sugar epimerase
MRLLVTGAGGFLGRAVVAAAARRGHAVRAMVRGAPHELPAGAQPVLADLLAPAGLPDAVRGVDAVIHLAAAKTGDLLAGNLTMTQNLLNAMAQAGVPHIVHISSLAVYDYLALRSFSTLDEQTPLDDAMTDRDDYARAKLLQEKLIRAGATGPALKWTVIRPGMIYGPGRLFNARVGFNIGKLWVRTGAWARIPLTYVENCADAIILAVEMREAQGQVFNVVDDQLPTQRRYARLIAQRISPRPLVIPVSWTILRCIARLAWQIKRMAPSVGAKIPGILLPPRLHARCKPLRYSNVRAKSVLGWSPRYGLLEALDRSAADIKPSPSTPPQGLGKGKLVGSSGGSA